MAFSKENLKTLSSHPREKTPNISLVASPSKVIPYGPLKHVMPLKLLRGKHTDEVVVFLLKVAALEAVRRLSKALCPVVWRVVQALQVFGCPPFSWLQRWGPLGIIVKAVQKFSRPVLCISLATAVFEHSDASEGLDDEDGSQAGLQLPSEPFNSDMRKSDESENTSKNAVSENWLQTILKELEKEEISVPERIDEDEIHRFYAASKGDLLCLLSSLKRTIRWRETYCLLLPEELEKWSALVFWHGFDVMHRPCLIIRLGLACSTLPPHDRPCFCQAVVSQMEYAVLHLINDADPRVTVLMDCEGLSPVRFPMQMMKSCATILQDHYPDRLAYLFVVRLPAISRVLIQAFIEVLRPATRQKLRIEGESYLKVLSEKIQAVPVFLGGKCTCSKCKMLFAGKMKDVTIDETSTRETGDDTWDYEPSADDYPATETQFNDCERYLKAVVLGILLLIIMIAFMAGYPNSSVSL